MKLRRHVLPDLAIQSLSLVEEIFKAFALFKVPGILKLCRRVIQEVVVVDYFLSYLLGKTLTELLSSQLRINTLELAGGKHMLLQIFNNNKLNWADLLSKSDLII